VALTAEVCHIGRAPTCDVVLEDPSVSRRHAVITRRGAATVILDDRSLNGVEVGGRRVAEAELRDGDVIRLGRVAVRYVEVAPPAAA
jgi:pSer/pThr/pTyr-binding forkhead associated (FHA) protein